MHIIKAIYVHDVTSLSWSVRMQKGRKEGRTQHVGSVSIFQLLSFVIQTYKNITYHLSRFLR